MGYGRWQNLIFQIYSTQIAPPFSKWGHSYYHKTRKKEYTTYIGIKDNLCWRKDVYRFLRCYYANVTPANKKKYDRIMDKLKVVCEF